MYIAQVDWIPGENNVDSQECFWEVNDQQIGEVIALSSTANSRSSQLDNVTINHGDTVRFSVRSINQWAASDWASATGAAPTPSPDSPSQVTMTFHPIPESGGAVRR